MHCSKSSEGRRLCGSYARGRKRPWHVIVDFSSLSYSYNFRSRARARGGVEYTRLNYEYLCNRRHVVHFGQLSSTCLASPRLRPSSTFSSLFVCPGERHRCGCPFGAGLSVSENLNCPNIRYEFSLLHWPHFHVPSLGWQ